MEVEAKEDSRDQANLIAAYLLPLIKFMNHSLDYIIEKIQKYTFGSICVGTEKDSVLCAPTIVRVRTSRLEGERRCCFAN